MFEPLVQHTYTNRKTWLCFPAMVLGALLGRATTPRPLPRHERRELNEELQGWIAENNHKPVILTQKTSACANKADRKSDYTNDLT